MTDEIVKIKDSSSLVRDMTSKAIINTNSSEYEHAKRVKLEKMKEKQRLNALETKVNMIFDLLNDINDKLGTN